MERTNKMWLRVLGLVLALCMLLPLAACNQTPDTPAHTHAGGTATCTQKAVCDECGESYGSLAAHQYENGTCSVCGADENTPPEPGPGGEDPAPGPGTDDPQPTVYPNGGEIKSAGATIASDSAILTPTVYDETGADEVNANQFFRSAVKEKGKVIRIVDGKPVTIGNSAGQTYDGKGAILVAPNGLLIKDSYEITLTNLVIVGAVTLENSNTVRFENVEIVSTETALTADAASANLVVDGCRLTGKTALALAGDGATVLNSYIAFTETGIADTAKSDTTVQNCILEGSGTGIATTATLATVRYCTLKMGEQDTGILLGQNTFNTLVAQNEVTGAQRSIAINGVTNTSLVLNSVISIEAENSKNLYIIDNAMGGRLTANNNNYFIADGNTYPDDEYDHETVQSGNQNHNGDSLMDVDARLEVGADDRLLPHVDKDQFVGMERYSRVKDVLAEEELALVQYITEKSKTDEIVIVQPGAYIGDSTLNFQLANAHTTIYAYGVYMERQEGLGQMGNYYQTEDITLKGLTMGYKQQTCGQVYVLEKLGNKQVRVVTGAGMMNEFGNTNAKYYDVTGMGAQRMGTFYAYCDTSFRSITKDNSTAVPTMIMTLSESVYNMLAVGDILTCRANNGTTSVSCSQVTDIAFKDVTLYGSAAGLAFYENEAYTGIQYYRVADTTQNGFIIDEETYNAYLALEDQYGIDLEIEIDELGRFRGSPAHIGSIDATHVVACAQGSQATSCLFENMCDDATNQHAHHSRLADVRDQGNGKTLLIYKPNLSQRSSESGSRSPGGMAKNFKVGDRVYVYTSKGQLVCDTPALSVTSKLSETEPNSLLPGSKIQLYSVTVPTESVNFEALKGYDLSDDHWESKNKVLVDNMDMASNYFNFDNSKFQNIRSRGLLIKASNGTITNCTFRNIGMSCGAILYEIYWGESGVTEDLLVDRNLFDHTGYFKNQDLYATISITGLGSSVDEDFLLYKDIIISNNVMRNRTTDYAVYVNSAKNVKILNNDFGPFVGNDFGIKPEEPESENNPKPAIHIFAAMDIEISGNKYSREDWTVDDYIHCEKNIHVYGSDVEFEGIPLIPNDK
ncbi:MAG: right-handed parallel beta-helix repeat-containing protein [Clostridia bacterium]|nr:right-handed parallel beta-helix repeat-containing protein [Clostridia bacterium]